MLSITPFLWFDTQAEEAMTFYASIFPRAKVLSVNRRNGYATLLLDVKPGTRFPAHHHEGDEECYVISGSIFTLGRRLGPGDFVHADAGTEHGELWTDEGARVLLVVPPEDYMPLPSR